MCCEVSLFYRSIFFWRRATSKYERSHLLTDLRILIAASPVLSLTFAQRTSLRCDEIGRPWFIGKRDLRGEMEIALGLELELGSSGFAEYEVEVVPRSTPRRIGLIILFIVM